MSKQKTEIKPGDVCVSSERYRDGWEDRLSLTKDAALRLLRESAAATDPSARARINKNLTNAQPPKSSNVKGTLRVIMPHPDTCNGKGVDLVELTEEALVTPSAAGPKMHRYKVEPIPPARWAE